MVILGLLFLFIHKNKLWVQIRSASISLLMSTHNICFMEKLTPELSLNIGITHGFSCINICQVPRKLFEREATRLSVQISSEGPG